MTDPFGLSDREIEILELLALGASNKEIATRLVISTNTVKVHLRNIYAKLGVNSRTEAAMLGLRENMIDVEGIATNDSDSITGEIRNRSLTIPGIGIRVEQSRGTWILTLLVAVMFLVGIISMFLLIRGGSREDTESFIADRWERRSDLPTPRSGLALAVYANQIYAIGGETRTGVTGVMERYDPILDKWTTLVTKPLPVTDVKAAVIGERIYVPGGRLETGEPTDVVEVYDPILSEWNRIRSLPIKLSGYALVAFEGNLYLFGGWDGEKYIDSCYAYDPQADSWIALADMPTARAGLGAAVIRDSIHVLGGYDGASILDVHEVYHPDSGRTFPGTWDHAATMPMPLRNMGVESVADIIHVLGGENPSGEGGSLLLKYFALRDRWETVTLINSEGWWDMGLESIETRLIVMGGIVNSRISNRNWNYQAIYMLILPAPD